VARDRPAIHVLLTAFLGLLLLNPANAGEARVIQLKHRPASEVMPLVRPLLEPDDLLHGTDYRLIIRTSDGNLKEVERVLAQVDVARQRLRITVEQAVAGDSARTSGSVTGQTRIGDNTRIILPGTSRQDDGLIVQKDGLRYQTSRRTGTTRGVSTQTVMTMDGQRAYIRVGQSVPHVRKILSLRHRQAVLVQDIELQDVTTGFDVLPRVHGDRVLVEITPRLSSLRNPATGLADFQELSTTVETKPGEWLDLGEILGNRDEVNRAILESAATVSGERRTVRIRIE
jgi:type II secretory pathway component GspD/PulD (secretin)